MNLSQLQQEQAPWVKHNFPGRTWENPFMGIVEEVGELSHHLLKQKQGIRGSHSDHEDGIKDSVADIVIFLSDFCEARGYDFGLIVQTTWSEVRKRDWRNDSQNGIAKEGAS